MSILNSIKKSDTGKDILDCPEKIVAWIEYKLEIQKAEANKNRYSHNPYIDLSNCVIYTQTYNEKPALTNLCDLAGKLGCIIKTTKENHKFHQAPGANHPDAPSPLTPNR